MHYISIVSTIITFVFAGAVFYRFKQRGGIHLLYWGIGLLLYGIGTLMEAIMLFTFAPLALKLWYLTGAMLTAAWLGQGTVNLLVRKRNITRLLNAILLGVSLLALVLVLFAPVDAVAAQSYNLDQPASGQYQAIMERSGLMILLTILLNIYGTITLVGGAIYSAFLFWRKKVLLNRMLGNVLIAAGALMPAMAGSFVRAGLVDWLYLSEFIGVVLMYTGFLLATASQPVKSPTPAVAG